MEINLMFSILILAVAGIRLLGRERINPILQYGLWGILPLRALVFLCQGVFLKLPQT